MVHLLVDTCIWLDIPKDPSQRETINYLEELCKLGEVSLIVPRTVLDEFVRNRARISHECGQSLSTVLKRVKDAIRKFGPPAKRERDKTLQKLNDLDHKLPFLSQTASETLNQIETLLNRFPVVETTDPIMLRAAKRAASNVAPCHTGRNSINDAIILETYVEALANTANGQRLMFATHNKKDFSHKEDQRNPHPDIAPLFSKIKSRFFISLVEAIRRILSAGGLNAASGGRN